MELEKFIAESLEAIVKGLDEANVKLAPLGACVNAWDQTDVLVGGETCRINDVNFDIAVTVSKKSETEGKISVFSIGGAGGNIANGNEQVSRLSFSLKVAIPVKDLV